MTADTEWLRTPEPGWDAFDIPADAIGASFVSGDRDSNRIALQYYQSPDLSMIAKVILGSGAQGPPGHVHGGAMAALLDETMGASAWLAGHWVVAAELTVAFREMLPLGTRCIIEARVKRVEGRKVRTVGRIRDEDGTVFSKGKALFIALHKDRFGLLADQVEALRAAGAPGAVTAASNGRGVDVLRELRAGP